jgi:hypothetical protein
MLRALGHFLQSIITHLALISEFVTVFFDLIYNISIERLKRESIFFGRINSAYRSVRLLLMKIEPGKQLVL